MKKPMTKKLEVKTKSQVSLIKRRLGEAVSDIGLHSLSYRITVESRYLEVDWTIFYKFKLPEVQMNLHFG